MDIPQNKIKGNCDKTVKNYQSHPILRYIILNVLKVLKTYTCIYEYYIIKL